MAIPSQTVQIPLSSGLNQRMDARAKAPPALDICKDVQFDRTGGLQTRFPFLSSTIGTNIFGGGVLANIRRIVDNGGELLCFTIDTLYSWNAQLSAWVSKGTHLAVTSTETPVASTSGDQYDCDFATMNGVSIYTWTETLYQQTFGSSATVPWITAIDNATGNILLPPTWFQSPLTGVAQLRLVALQTKILCLFNYTVTAAATLGFVVIDPVNVSAAVTATPIVILSSSNANQYYDVTQVIGTDTAAVVARFATTADYFVAIINSAGGVPASRIPTRACTGPIAVSCTPDGLHLQVVRSSSSAITGDLLLASTLADVFTGQALGSVPVSVSQIAACHRNVQNSGHYRCYVYWSYNNGGPLFGGHAWVDDNNTINTSDAPTLALYYLHVASRGFSYNGNVYTWFVFSEANETGWSTFGGALQNTFFLFRDDGLLVAQACPGSAGGPVQSLSHLPQVSLTSGTTGFSWAGNIRRIVNLNGVVGYASRAPRAISFAFDDNQGRRTVRIGMTTYITGSIISQYDGVRIVELGWLITPWAFAFAPLGSGGHLSAGGYGVKCTFRWDNATGEVDRSTTANVGTVTAVASDELETLGVSITPATRKAFPVPACECWRTVVNPLANAPFYLTSSNNPANASNPNRYLPAYLGQQATSTYADILSDAAVSTLETNPENGATLPAICPDPSTVIAVSDTRVFLSGIAGFPDTVWYSKAKADGRVIEFNDSLTIAVPPSGGAITAIGFLNESLVIWRQTATYVYGGEGFDNLGGGSNYAIIRYLSEDVGAVSQEATLLVEDGLMFKSKKGWHLIGLDQSLHYIGDKTYDYDSDTVIATHVMTSQQQVRILTNNRMLVFDWNVGQWGEWTIAGGVSACTWNGVHMYTDGTNIYQQSSTYSGVTYGMDVETAWIKMNDLQGDGRVRRILGIGEYRSEHNLRIRVARNYTYDGSGNVVYMDDVVWTVTPTTVGSVEQFSHGPTYQQCEAIKIRLTAVDATVNTNPPTGEALRLTGLALKLAVKPTPYPRLPAAQKA